MLLPKIASFEVVWKGSLSTPLEEFRRINQFMGAYASATMDKVMEVLHLFKEKEDIIVQLE